MATRRDPLSVHYDRSVKRAIRAAAEAHKVRRGVTVWVSSPPAEFRALDERGRTVHERAFTRSAYYQVVSVPRALKVAPTWSLRLTWGPVAKRHGRWGRQVTIRLYRYRRAATARVSSPSFLHGGMRPIVGAEDQ